jgi:hypothetical protein
MLVTMIPRPLGVLIPFAKMLTAACGLARAATTVKAFGQEDDITVLTVARSSELA